MVGNANHKRNRPVPKPNYQFENDSASKRRRKKAEKAQRKAATAEEAPSNVGSDTLLESK